MLDLGQWGFTPDIFVEVSSKGVPSAQPSHNARTRRLVIYASQRDDGLALKIGITRNTLWERWRGTLRVIGAEKDRLKLRDNEWSDRDQWRQHVLGHRFTVWSKPLISPVLCYADGLPKLKIDISRAEERYLDALLEPVIGRPLSLRGKL